MPNLSPRALRLAALVWMAAVLSACSSPSLDVAPVVDLSAGSGAPAAPAAAPVPVAEGTVVVRPGDTLFHLALNHHVAMHDLVRWNQLDPNVPLKVGQTLVVRDPAQAQAPAGVAAAAGQAASPGTAAGEGAGADDTGGKVLPIAPAPGVGQARPLGSVDAPSALAPVAAAIPGAAASVSGIAPGTDAGKAGEPAPAPATTPAAMPDKPDWVWPVDGEVVQPFDAARQKGIFIAVASDAPVRAVADGTVSYVGTYLDYGKLIIITHDDRMRTVYGQNKTLVVKQGQSVRRGEMIATAGGNRGDAGTRFRFEVRLKGVPVDPLPYLPAR